MALFLLDHGAGNVQSLANSIKRLGYPFSWISTPEDFQKATVLIFPGQGAFHTAIECLTDRGLLLPLLDYINSGKPYFGICIGMQVLFASSAESPSVRGLGAIPCDIVRFDDTNKAVPHMGWNTAECLDPSSDPPSTEGLSVTVALLLQRNPVAAEWAHSTTQYGNEVFVSTVRKGNVFGAQFHPEKSGAAGLAILDAWIKQSWTGRVPTATVTRVPRPPKPVDGFTKRIIACMDVRANDEGDLVVTKGDQYDVREKTAPNSSTISTAGVVRNLGKPVALASKYFESGADELCLLNITSFRNSPLHDQPMLAVVRAAAERVFTHVDPDGTKRPAVEVAGAYFRVGADKVSIGSEAVYAVEKLRTAGSGDGTSAIETISKMYGRQAVVVSVDPRRVYVDPSTYDGPYMDELVYGKDDGPTAERGKAWWYQCTVSGGRETRPVSAGLGFDHDLIGMIKRAVTVPVVASSGAGTTKHFVDVFQETKVESALAAGIFHRDEVSIRDVKTALQREGFNTRVI
ncbi:class I glutamine amidotransferase-like protein [Pisolithus marmoratus]|nr:class I glutamine amidotransferase-like protein [Pisolithus marmoratus]